MVQPQKKFTIGRIKIINIPETGKTGRDFAVVATSDGTMLMDSGERKKKKKRKSLLTKRKNFLEELAKKYVHLRDNDICQKCGKPSSGRDCHVSHVKSKGSYPRLRADVINLKILCYHCHRHWWHKEIIDATNWFKDKFPDRYEYLEIAKQDQRKLTLDEVEQKIEELQDMLVGLDMRDV